MLYDIIPHPNFLPRKILKIKVILEPCTQLDIYSKLLVLAP